LRTTKSSAEAEGSSLMNKRKLQKNRRRLLAKTLLTPEEERWVIEATQRLSKASGVIPLGELPPEEQLLAARRIIEESRASA
jgi:hypothetical protein